MIALIDNYDSFVYNLYQFIGEFTEDIKVFRNDCVTLEELEEANLSGIVLSPGPGRPEDAGICTDIVKRFKGRVPILGICLGHQAIAHSFGCSVVRCREIVHGKVSDIRVNRSLIFEDMEDEFRVMRYHSLVLDRDTLPEEFEVIAETKDGIVMGIGHNTFPIYGLQFHPESIMTQGGKKIISNFVRRVCNVG
ncbi:MAG: aminodeoxychorismate/anthranilate synthase component II [Bacillota bacterium]|nr:aminodeoxychorismate/anthranilate synthase component II [Bacillota bacterium]